jgi:PST family polysaccharide transporter
LRLFPTSLRQRFEHRPDLIKIAGNIGWLFSDRILRMGIGLLISVWLARYLGPQQFGLMNYAMAFVVLFSALSSLGLNGIVVRDLINTPDEINTTLGTAFILMLLGGGMAFGLALAAMSLARPDDALAKLMVAVLGFTMIFKASEVVKYWFESKVSAKYSVWVENLVFLIQAALKALMILGGASLMAFIWLAFVEALLVAAGLLVIYAWREGSPKVWRWQAVRAKSLLESSWPLVLSGLAIMVYMRIDQIMLGLMLDDRAVGNYSAAIRISEIWYFIPMAIATSVSPSLLETKKTNERLYYQRLQQLFNLMVVMGLAVAIPMTFLSDWLVVFLFGPSYVSAGSILSIHIWTAVFVFLGVASSQWLIAENLQKIAFYRTLTGAIVNIALNLFMIPKYGGVGAALSTVASQVSAAYLFDALNPKTRKLFAMKTKSLSAYFLIQKVMKS